MCRERFNQLASVSSSYVIPVSNILTVSNLSATISHISLIDSSANVRIVIVVVPVVTGLRRNFLEAQNRGYINVTESVVIV